MNKKVYQQPAMRVVKIQHSQMLCSSPGTHDEVSTKPSYARGHRGWDDEEEDEDE